MANVIRLRTFCAVVVLGLVAVACGSSTESTTADDGDSTELAEVGGGDVDEASGTTQPQPDEAEVSTGDSESGDAGQDDGIDESQETATTTTTTTSAPALERPVFGPPDSLTPDCSAVPAEVSVGLATASLSSGGNDYTYQWTVPSSYDGSPLSVVLDFHGIGSNGAQQAVFSEWAATAEAEGFLSVQPTGLSAAGDDRPSWELPQFDTDERDDVTFVVDLIADIGRRVCIDPSRVYATGMSNGGLFTSTLLCDLSERIAAGVSVAGVTHHDGCSPTRAVPYLAFHGTADTVVPFNGGGESTLDGAELGGDFFEQVIPEEFAQFADSFGCTSSQDSEVTADITLTSYSGCTDGVPLGFYTIEGGGHTWPGSPISAAISTLGFTNTDISATEIAWDFFTQHQLG